MDYQHPEYAKIAAQIPELGGGPPKVRAFFRFEAEIDRAATEATGRADGEILQPACAANGYVPVVKPATNAGFIVYRDVLHIEEHAEGERDFVSVAATDEHRRKYPDAWAAFERQQQEKRHDVRLCHGITPAAIETFRGLKIGTMEALAAHTGDLPPQFDRHRQFARRFLSVVNGAKPKYRIVDGVATQIED